MLEKPKSNRPEWKSDIISKVFQKCIIDHAAWSEIRFVESGNITDEICDTFYWSGKTSSDRKKSGVATYG